jgi:hypothetical protein
MASAADQDGLRQVRDLMLRQQRTSYNQETHRTEGRSSNPRFLRPGDLMYFDRVAAQTLVAGPIASQ